MAYRDRLGYYGACNVQQHYRSDYTSLRSTASSVQCLDLEYEFLDCRRRRRRRRRWRRRRRRRRRSDEEEEEKEVVEVEELDVVEVEEVCVHLEERKGQGGEGAVVVSQILMFAATSASTLHLVACRTSSS